MIRRKPTSIECDCQSYFSKKFYSSILKIIPVDLCNQFMRSSLFCIYRWLPGVEKQAALHYDSHIITTPCVWPITFSWPWESDSHWLFIMKHKPPWNWRKHKLQITQAERVNSLRALQQRARGDLWTCSYTIGCFSPFVFAVKRKYTPPSLFCAEFVFVQCFVGGLITEAGIIK